jgi:hypothetical protein
MKPWFLCLVLLTSTTLLATDAFAAIKIEPGVFDPRKRPDGPYLSCPTKETPRPINPWNCGCSTFSRCCGRPSTPS